MEFFNYLNIPIYILQYFQSGTSAEQFYLCFGIAGIIYFVSLILGGIGLYVMATKLGIKHAWLAFFPFANTYFAGEVAGKTNIFGVKIKHVGLYAMLLEVVYVVMEILSVFITVKLSDPMYYETIYTSKGAELVFHGELVSAAMQWMLTGRVWIPIVGLVLELLLIFLLGSIYIQVFRKFSPSHPVIMSLVSVLFPIRAFTTFAVRNNEPVDYGDFMKKRLEEFMRGRGVNPQTPNGDPAQSSDPFAEYRDQHQSKQPPSPFSEFDDDNKKD